LGSTPPLQPSLSWRTFNIIGECEETPRHGGPTHTPDGQTAPHAPSA
jgi:hypothetical protein